MNNTNNSRNTILDCALRLFSERGYDGVGISEITQAAGITKPTLYYFFQSKEGVLKAILEEYYERFNRILNTVCVYTPNTQEYFKDIQPVLVAAASACFDFALENPVFYRMALSYLFAPPTGATTGLILPYHQVQQETLIRLFSDISSVHTNLKGKEARLSKYFLAVINSEIAAWYQGGDAPTAETAGQLVHQFMHGIFA